MQEKLIIKTGDGSEEIALKNCSDATIRFQYANKYHEEPDSETTREITVKELFEQLKKAKTEGEQDQPGKKKYMQECPFCKYVGVMEDIDGYILQCPKCNKDWNESDHDCTVEVNVEEEVDHAFEALCDIFSPSYQKKHGDFIVEERVKKILNDLKKA